MFNYPTSNCYTPFWLRLFPVTSKTRDMRNWTLYYENSWLLYYILQPKMDADYAGSLFIDNKQLSKSGILEHSEICKHDKTILSASNSLHASVLNYLWASKGSNVFLSYRANEVPEISNDSLGQMELILQQTISHNTQFNEQISFALKNAIDFGSGYLTMINGYYEAVHPVYVAKGRTAIGQEQFFIVDRGLDHYWIFGKKETATILGIEIKHKYFAAKIIPDNKEKNELVAELVEDYVPLIVDLSLSFYRNESGISVGCGTMAVTTVLGAGKLLLDAFDAQRSELKPAMLVSSLGVTDSEFDPSAGRNIYYDSALLAGSEFAKPIMPPRAANSTAYIEFWRASIRQLYFLDQLIARGVGQTTAVDASRNAGASSALFENMIYPFFNGFMVHALRNFTRHYYKKELPDNLKKAFNKKLHYRFIGNFSSDIANKDAQYVQLLVGTISSLAQIDPSITAIADVFAIANKTLQDSFPASFFKNKEEYEEILRRAQQAGDIENA